MGLVEKGLVDHGFSQARVSFGNRGPGPLSLAYRLEKWKSVNIGVCRQAVVSRFFVVFSPRLHFLSSPFFGARGRSRDQRPESRDQGPMTRAAFLFFFQKLLNLVVVSSPLSTASSKFLPLQSLACTSSGKR